MLHGQGLLRYENGDQYEGTFFDGQRHGKGRMVWKEGHWYEGDWLRDRRHGEGKFSKVSALGYFLCNFTVERTLENVYHRLRDRRQGDGTHSQNFSQQ
jgi:hypothetical protein